MSERRLAGKTAIITGASTGLGPVMAKVFVDQGAKVLLTARREELVREAAASCGDGAIAMRADLTEEDDVIAMVTRAVAEFGKVDILCNNAAAQGQTATSGSRRSKTGTRRSPSTSRLPCCAPARPSSSPCSSSVPVSS